MSSEDSKILEICPVCGTELGFIHISLEEDAKICMNEECLYPFAAGTIYEFRPWKRITKEDFCTSEEHMEALKRKIESEFQEQGLNWETYNGNELLSIMDLQGDCKLDDMLDSLFLKKEVDVGDSNSLNLDKFLDSLGTTPSNTKVIQSCTDNQEAEVNRFAAYEDSVKLVMSELEETLENMNVSSQIDIQWDADDFNTETFETNKSKVEPGGLETATALEQAAPFNYEPKKPNITLSDASMNRTMDSITSGLGTTATIEETCVQTICASEKSNDSGRRYTDQLNYLFTQRSFPKFEFPKFLKTDHNISKQIPKLYPRSDKTDHYILKQMPKMYSECEKKNKMDPEFDNTDHNLSKPRPKRHSECEKNKNKMDPEFDNAGANLLNQMPKMYSECEKNKNKMEPEFDDTDDNLLNQMPKRHSEPVKNNKMDPQFDNTDHNLRSKRHSECEKNKNKMEPEFDKAGANVLNQTPKRRGRPVKNKTKMDPQFDNTDHNVSKQMPKRQSERLKHRKKLWPPVR